MQRCTFFGDSYYAGLLAIQRNLISEEGPDVIDENHCRQAGILESTGSGKKHGKIYRQEEARRRPSMVQFDIVSDLSMTMRHLICEGKMRKHIISEKKLHKELHICEEVTDFGLYA